MEEVVIKKRLFHSCILTQMQARTFNKVVPLGWTVSEYLFAITNIKAVMTINTPETPNANGKQSSFPKHFTSCRRMGLTNRDVILPQLYTK